MNFVDRLELVMEPIRIFWVGAPGSSCALHIPHFFWVSLFVECNEDGSFSVQPARYSPFVPTVEHEQPTCIACHTFINSQRGTVVPHPPTSFNIHAPPALLVGARFDSTHAKLLRFHHSNAGINI